MRKKSRAMDSGWALEVMHKAPYITVSFIDEDGNPYGLPLSLASDDDVNWYFHGALEGKTSGTIKLSSSISHSRVYGLCKISSVDWIFWYIKFQMFVKQSNKYSLCK